MVVTIGIAVFQSADKALERLKKASEDDEKSATKRLEKERKEFQSEKKTWKDKHKQVRGFNVLYHCHDPKLVS